MFLQRIVAQTRLDLDTAQTSLSTRRDATASHRATTSS